MTYYQKHVFICTNQKEDGKKCCTQINGENAWKWLKAEITKREQHGPGKIRVSRSGCLGRCSEGPWVVCYPAGQWFNYQSQEDLQQIADKICEADN